MKLGVKCALEPFHEYKQSVGAALCICARRPGPTRQETPHISSMQLGGDPTKRVHKGGAGIAHQLTLEMNHALHFPP